MYILIFLVVVGAGWLIMGLSTMLSINMVHHYYWDFVPSISYGDSLAITIFPLLFAIFWRFVAESIKANQ